MAVKNSFVVYAELEKQINRMTDSQAGQLFRAMFVYNRGEEPAFGDPMVAMAFDFVQPVMDRNRDKYEQRCERNRQNILKRWEEKQRHFDRDTKNTSGTSGIQMNTNNTDNVPDKNNENEPDPVTENEPDPVPDPVPEKNENDNDNEKMMQAVSFFQKNVSKRLGNSAKEEMGAYIDTIGFESVIEAMKIASVNGKKSWGYVRGVIENWMEHGKPIAGKTCKKSAAASTGLTPARPLTPAQQEAEAYELEESRRQMMKILGLTGQKEGGGL